MKKFFSMLLLLCGFVTLSATLVKVNAAEKEVTYTVTSTTAVSCDDPNVQWTATYKGTFSTKCQATSGNSLTLTLSDFEENVVIKKLVMSTKTNSSKGAGTVVVTIGDTTVYSKAYEKPKGSTYIDYEIENTDASKGDLSVVISCTENSLYCQSYKIIYELEGDTTPSYDTVFNYNYEECPENVTVSTEDGNAVKFVSNPSRTGYIFLGWYDAAEGGNIVESLTSSEENHNKILYAHWEIDTNTHAIIDNTNFLTSTGGTNATDYTLFNGQHEISGVVFYTDQVLNGGELQFRNNTKGLGIMYNTVAISGHIKSITIAITSGEFKVSTSTSEMNAAGDNEATLTAANNKFVVTNSEDSYFFIQAGGSNAAKATSIDIAYEYVEKSTYTISFNEGRGSFVEGKGADIIVELGQTTTVVLPKATDMATTAYKHSVLSGWSDGSKSYQPGASVEVSGNKTFTAVYTAPTNLTIAKAIEVAEIAGTTATTFNFSTKATIKEIDNKNVILTDSSTTETFVAYNPSNLSSLSVGDQVTVVGKIKMFNTTKEYDAPKVTVTKPAYATAFEAEQTKASLKLDADGNVSIRFGNMISAASYNANATYGVVITKDAAVLNGLTKDVLEELSPNYAVDCHPVQVNAQGEEDANGEYYQFALVLTGVPQAEFTAEIVAAMYVVVGNNVYLAQTKTASVKSVAAAYLEGDTSNFSESTIEILTILAQA